MIDTEKQAHAFANMVVSKYLDHKDEEFILQDIQRVTDNQSITFNLYQVCFYGFLKKQQNSLSQDVKLLFANALKSLHRHK